MTTRSQEAALAEIEKRGTDLISKVRRSEIANSIEEQILGFDKLIEEHNLARELLLPILQGYYDSLMEGEIYAAAAILAKKYDL